MSTNGKQGAMPANLDDLLITDGEGGPHAMVERTITVQSVKLPETRNAAVEMIQIKESVIPLPSAAKKTATSK
jgi:hypothetical protein